MLQVVLGAASSAVPLLLLIPPMRRFTVFVSKFEDLLQDIIAEIFATCDNLQSLTSLIFGVSFRPNNN
ncbi:hypothetical protein BVRB_4g072610 [Beta vulgaris subsp. vulgaris]|nr:hypothetical protein BVRB_4g072610 [Beta vulgaris subsp. vulgaris]